MPDETQVDEVDLIHKYMTGIVAISLAVLVSVPANAFNLLNSLRTLALQTDLTDGRAVGRVLDVHFGPPRSVAIAYKDGVALSEIVLQAAPGFEGRFGGLAYKVPPYQPPAALVTHEVVTAELTIGSPIPPSLCVSTKQVRSTFGKPIAESHIGVDAPLSAEPNDVDWEIPRSKSLVVRLTTLAQGDDSACITAVFLRQVLLR